MLQYFTSAGMNVAFEENKTNAAGRGKKYNKNHVLSLPSVILWTGWANSATESKQQPARASNKSTLTTPPSYGPDFLPVVGDARVRAADDTERGRWFFAVFFFFCHVVVEGVHGTRGRIVRCARDEI